MRALGASAPARETPTPLAPACKTYSGSNACADFAKLLSLVTAYNDGSKVTYSFLAVGGYNSNSFTYTLLTQLGLSSYFGPPGGPQPGGAFLVLPGWNKTVPGL